MTCLPIIPRPALLSLALLTLAASALAQDDDGTVTIKREPAILRGVDDYQIPLSLKPARAITLRSPVDGTVKIVQAHLGKPAADQADLVAFDSELQRLELEAAEAATKTNYPTADIAKVNEQIAKLKLDRMTVRAPFAGEVVAVHVVPGAAVRAGEPVVELIDQTTLQTRIPVKRAEAQPGQTVQLRVESQTVDGTIKAVLPAGEQIGKLRPLFESLAEAVVEIKNPGNLVAGQTVYSDLIPRDPIIEVPTTAVLQTDDGGRAVFVLRQGYASAVPVQPLGQIGRERLYVSGRFAEGDEVVTSSSAPLVDGALVVQDAKTTTGQNTGTTRAPQQQQQRSLSAPARRGSAF